MAALMWRWYLNNGRAAFQLRMEDSREGKRDGEKELWMPSLHVGDEKDKRAIVYKTEKKEEKGSEKKEIIRACLKRLMAKTTLIALVALH